LASTEGTCPYITYYLWHGYVISKFHLNGFYFNYNIKFGIAESLLATTDLVIIDWGTDTKVPNRCTIKSSSTLGITGNLKELRLCMVFCNINNKEKPFH